MLIYNTVFPGVKKPSRPLWRLLMTIVTAMLFLDLLGLKVRAQAQGELHVEPEEVARYTVILDSYTFTPNHLLARAGQPIELTLRNESFLVPHNFILDIPGTEIHLAEEVGAGEEIILRFVVPHPGSFPFFCNKQLLFFPNHREEGMEGLLEVQ